MGKVQKVVWPQGKNLKPQPKGRAPVQAIPGPKPRKTPAEKRKDQEYRLALSKGQYPRGQSPIQALMADPFLRSWVELLATPPMCRDNRPALTMTSPEATGSTMLELREVLRLLTEAPAPSREPIEVTEAQYQALMGLPVAETPEELAELMCSFGMAVLVVKVPTAPLEGEILPSVTMEELMQEKSTELSRHQDAMMLAAATGCWKLS